MRGYHKRRSTLSLAIWAGAFLTLCLVLAWKFDWLPGSQPETPVEPTADNTGKSDESLAPPPLIDDDGPVPPADNPFEFGEQMEPGGLPSSHYTMPKNFEPPTPGKSGGDGIQLTGGIQPDGGTSNAKSHPLADVTPGSAKPPYAPGTGARRNGVSQAGYQKTQIDDSTPPVATLRRIDGLIQADKYLDAHKELSEIYWKHPEWRGAIRTRIEMTANVIYFSRKRHFLSPYMVKPNDQLRNIARRYNVSWQYLERLNGITARQIRPGMKLKVIKGPFSAVVDLSDREITVHHYGYFVCRYKVGIGKEDKTPLGKRTVDNKILNPRYEGRDEQGRLIVVKADDPRNPLGERWISLGDHYGIHGTIDPQSIGKAASRGCIRMHNKDVAIVYDFLTVGSEVRIQR